VIPHLPTTAPARCLAGVACALVALLAGCSSSASANIPAPTATTMATATATSTPVPTVTPAQITACFGSGVTASQVTLSGDYLFEQLSLNGLTYPSVMLPDGTPTTKPYKLTGSGPSDYAVDFPTSPITNPEMDVSGGGFILNVCNVSSSKAHVLQAVSAKIASFTAYTNALNEWQACNAPIDSHHNPQPGGCGGAVALCDCFHASFPDNSPVGAEEVMTQTDASLNNPGDMLAKLPFTLAPGKSLHMAVGMAVPKPAGQYAFAFNLQFDGAKVASPTSPTVLLAPVAHEWTGQACLTSSLLSQITATNPETYYICPK
jgi:hypothetical protein